jgi:DNA-binding response OmpR family regulator
MRDVFPLQTIFRDARLDEQSLSMCGKAKILVVENEIPTAMMMVSLLTQAGLDVEATAKGQKGLEIAQERKFDLILLETNLPDISGLKICAELRQRHISYRTPVVFISAQSGHEVREQALELGAADFIEKPFDAREFVSRILSHLEETTPV